MQIKYANAQLLVNKSNHVCV